MNHFRVDNGIVNEKSFPKIGATAILEPYTGTTTPNGGKYQYSDRKLTVKVGQSYLFVDPEDARQLYFATAANKIKSGKVLHEEIVTRKILEDVLDQMNTKCFYKGDAAGVNADKAFVTFDGLEKQLIACMAADLVTDKTNSIVPVVTPAFQPGMGFGNTVSNWGNTIENIKKVDGAHSLSRKSFSRDVFVNHDIFSQYIEDYRRRHGNEAKFQKENDNDFGFVFLDGTSQKAKLRPATWLGTSQRIISCIPGAIVAGTDTASMVGDIKVQEEDFLIKYLLKVVFGVQIIDPSCVKVNTLA